MKEPGQWMGRLFAAAYFRTGMAPLTALRPFVPLPMLAMSCGIPWENKWNVAALMQPAHLKFTILCAFTMPPALKMGNVAW